MRPGLALAIVLTAVLALGAPARAERVAVLQVDTEGVTTDAVDRFVTAIEEGLAGAGFEVMPRVATAIALAQSDAPEGCMLGPCLGAAGRILGASKVLVARITAAGPSYTFILTLLETRGGAPVRQVVDSCPVCTVDEAISQMTLSIVSLGTGQLATVAPAVAVAKRASRVRTTAWWMTGLAVLAAAGGGVALAYDNDPAAYASLGASAGLALAGITLFVISK